VAKRGIGRIVPTMGELDEWKHCPRCGSNQLLVEQGAAECLECGFRAYASAKPTASAACLDDEGRVLLSRRGKDPFKDMWDLPGGFLDEEEHPLDCLRRELREEGAVEVEPLDFLGVWIDKYGGDGLAQTTLNFYWTARIVAGTLEPADDVAEFRWFAPDEVDEDELAFAHTREVLSHLRQKHA
jgi:ADP-ribose pyrophosphatase YjhB (NUDIX family)